jgi:hypothetical protein
VSARCRIEHHVQPRGGESRTPFSAEIVAWHLFEVSQAQFVSRLGWG